MLTLEGVPLDDSARRWTVEYASRWRQPPPVVINNVVIPGQHGSIPAADVAFAPGTASLVMMIHGNSYADRDANYRTLCQMMASTRIRTLTDTTLSQFARVQYVSASEMEIWGVSDARVTFSLGLPYGFWQDVNAAEIDLGTTTGTKTPAALNGGSAPIVDPIIVATGSGTVSFRMADTETGTWLQWTGTIPAGQSLRIEPDNETAWLVPSGSPWTGGTSVSGLLSLSPGQFQLSASNNFQVTKNWTAQTLMRARRAYL